jgi:hypothetical protein
MLYSWLMHAENRFEVAFVELGTERQVRGILIISFFYCIEVNNVWFVYILFSGKLS